MARPKIIPAQSKIPSVAVFNKARAALRKKHSVAGTDELIGSAVRGRTRYEIAQELMGKMGHQS